MARRARIWGVVNRDLRLHTMDNLYAAVRAVFPTGSFANPALTLIALAVRRADHLRARP
jgi:choline dehydrogenase-like flavoprotein